jgi:fermentation-respiration switch protein FrsA (DUF1100 family)
VKENDIVVCGRSIGTGPASYLGSRKHPCSVALIAPYTSIRDVASSLLGSAVSMIVYERFHNLELVSRARCPVFIVHGKKDTLIPCSHAVQLKEACPTFCQLLMPEDMQHNSFDVIEHFVTPFQGFLEQVASLKKKSTKVMRIVYSDSDSSEDD